MRHLLDINVLIAHFGEVVGPIDAGEGSHYLLYIPKTLRKGRLYFAGHGGAPPWLRTEGIVWLNGRHLANNRRSREIEVEGLDYEASMIDEIVKQLGIPTVGN